MNPMHELNHLIESTNRGNVPSSHLLHGHRQTILSNLLLLDLRLCAVWNSWMLAHCMMRCGTNVTCLDAIMPETGVAALAVTVRFRGMAIYRQRSLRVSNIYPYTERIMRTI